MIFTETKHAREALSEVLCLLRELSRHESSSLHVQAAVNGPDLPGDGGGRVCRQETDHPGDLLGRAQAADRDLGPDPVQHLVRDSVHHAGGDEAGHDRIDGQPDTVPDRVLGPAELENSLARQRLGQPQQAGLGGGIVHLANVAGLADDRGHTLMIRPLPQPIMCSTAAWAMKKAPDRLIAMTLCQSSSVILATVRSIVMPALFTRMSTRPCFSITSCATAGSHQTDRCSPRAR